MYQYWAQLIKRLFSGLDPYFFLRLKFHVWCLKPTTEKGSIVEEANKMFEQLEEKKEEADKGVDQPVVDKKVATKSNNLCEI